jgi:hypothetical protein
MSFSPDASPLPLTAATARPLVAGWSDLPRQRRRDLGSALNAVARIAQLPASNTALTPAFLRQHVLCKSEAACGLSASRLSSVRSDLNYILDRAGVIDRIRTAPSPAWDLLLEAVGEDRRPGFIRFARFCSAREIVPDKVDEQVMTAFHSHLVERTLAPDPTYLLRRLRIAWNRACRQVATWPGRPVPVAKNQTPGILPFQAFPESFQQDLAGFGRWWLLATPLDALDDEGDLSPEGVR